MAPMDAASDGAQASAAGATNINPPPPAPPPPPPVTIVAQEAFEKLRAKVKALRPNEDLAPLEKAFQFAARLHAGQARQSGEPYLMHPAGRPRPARRPTDGHGVPGDWSSP